MLYFFTSPVAPAAIIKGFEVASNKIINME